MSRRRISKHKFRLLVWTAAGLALALLGRGVIEQGTLSPSVQSLRGTPGLYSVEKVIDGDTIVVRIAGRLETVRLIGIDTPEVKDPRKPMQCFGQAASHTTHQLLDGSQVRLTGDTATSDRDKYHRLLRYVYRSDGMFINQYLVEQGYAFAYTVFPNAKLEQFRLWEAEARSHNRGLWSGCHTYKNGDIEQTQNQ